MPSPIRARIAVLVAAATVLVPQAARAERVEMVDGAGDAMRLDWETSGKDDPRFVPAPEETSVDIVRTVASYRPGLLAVRVRFHDLVRLDDLEMTYRVVDPRGTTTWVDVAVKRPDRVEVTATRNERDLACRGPRAALDVERDRIALSLPARCLGTPRWVRVGVLAEGTEDTATPEHPVDFEWYLDDGVRGDVDVQELATPGPPVRRG